MRSIAAKAAPTAWQSPWQVLRNRGLRRSYRAKKTAPGRRRIKEGVVQNEDFPLECFNELQTLLPTVTVGWPVSSGGGRNFFAGARVRGP